MEPETQDTQTVRDCVEKIANGQLNSTELVGHCLEVVDKTDAEIDAWAFLDKEQALAQAEDRDLIRRSGEPVGELHGIPVGLKDILDTADMPTERGSEIFAGRQPDADCAVVERLKEAGAVIMGKTVTTEMAFMHPRQQRIHTIRLIRPVVLPVAQRQQLPPDKYP